MPCTQVLNMAVCAWFRKLQYMTVNKSAWSFTGQHFALTSSSALAFTVQSQNKNYFCVGLCNIWKLPIFITCSWRFFASTSNWPAQIHLLLSIMPHVIELFDHICYMTLPACCFNSSAVPNLCFVLRPRSHVRVDSIRPRFWFVCVGHKTINFQTFLI